MRNIKDDEAAVVSGGTGEDDGGIYYSPDGAPALNPGLVPPGRAPVVPLVPGGLVG